MTYIMQEYDEALRFILKNGIRKSNRTGVDTLSVFGIQSRYRIDQYFPILTKRKMFYSSIFKELLWIISGSTNVNDLEKMGSKIWTAWRDKEFEQKNGYLDGELGPIYGHQLRHFGASYEDDSFRNYTTKVEKWAELSLGSDKVKEIKSQIKEYKGFDQLAYVVNELKTNKQSRRIMFSYWNPAQVTTDKVKLPPCHDMMIFNVDNENRLSGMLSQRSGDFPIGIPANIQFYSAMIYMLAQQCELIPHELVHAVADAHIYVNQIQAVEEYLSRQETVSPILILNKANDMFSYTPEDFIIENYKPLDKIEITVAL